MKATVSSVCTFSTFSTFSAFCTVLVQAAIAAAQPSAASPRQATGILTKMDSLQALIRYESAIVEMRLFDGGEEVRSRTMEMQADNTEQNRKALAVFTDPADIRGTGLLTVETGSETEQQLYLPALRRVQRVSGAQRKDRFAGSDFLYEDLRPRDPDDYRSTILEETAETLVLELIPNDEDSPYSRIEAAVDREMLVITEARYFDQAGRLSKILVATGHTETRPNVWKPERMVMTDILEDRSTELRYLERDNETVIPPETFTERQLRRGS